MSSGGVLCPRVSSCREQDVSKEVSPFLRLSSRGTLVLAMFPLRPTVAARIAWSTWAVAMLLFAVSVFLFVTRPRSTAEAFDPHLLLVPGYVTVGAAIVARRSANRIGWLFLALRPFVEGLGGKVRFAPLRLLIRTGKFREPDIMLMLDAGDAEQTCN